MWDILNFSRSTQSALRECPFLGFMRYYYDGTGIQKVGFNWDLTTGSLFHNIIQRALNSVLEGNALIPYNTMISEALSEYNNEMASTLHELDGLNKSIDYEAEEVEGWHRKIKEQGLLAESMARIWLLHRLPYFRENYTLLAVEKEQPYKLTENLLFQQRNDSVWRSNDTGRIHIVEMKSAGSNSDADLDSWKFDHQVITELANVREEYGEEPASVFLEVMWKGRKYNGVFTGSIMKGYKRYLDFDPLSGSATVDYDFDYNRCRKKVWESFAIYDEDFPSGGMSNAEFWIEHVLDYEERNKYVYTREIQHDSKVLGDWQRDTTDEFTDVRNKLVQLEGLDGAEKDETSKRLFRQHKSKFTCTKFFGTRKCAFIPICFGEVELENALECGLYKRRVPHHEGELEQVPKI